jgi:hypothetical protein
MKSFGQLLIILALLLLLTVATKPSDQQCIVDVRRALAGSDDGIAGTIGSIFSVVAVNRQTIHVEDFFFYKKIYAADGTEVGTAAFGTVWVCQ